MQFLQFTAAAVISYLGLLAGFYLASVTTEELSTGRKYFPFLQRLVILIIAVIVANYLGYSTMLRVLIYAVIVFMVMFRINIRLFYAVFGFALFAVAQSANFLLITAALIFLSGLVSGSEYFAMTVKRKSQIMVAAKRLLLQNLAYPAIALILVLLPFRFG